LKKRFANFLFWLGGFHFVGKPTKEMMHCVFIDVPHTSMWDFVWGRCGLWVLGVKAHFFIKKEMFFFPLGLILKALGGVSIDRGGRENMVEKTIKLLNENENYSVIITPEGTRKYTRHWKKGFYLIAMGAKVPIYLSYIDYAKKEASMGELFYPTGDYEKDLVFIWDYYKDKGAKYPANFNLSKQYRQ